MDVHEAVIRRILELCRERKWSLYRLEEESGIPHSTLLSIFHGESRNTGIRSIMAICRALGISLAVFFDSPLFA